MSNFYESKNYKKLQRFSESLVQKVESKIKDIKKKNKKKIKLEFCLMHKWMITCVVYIIFFVSRPVITITDLNKKMLYSHLPTVTNGHSNWGVFQGPMGLRALLLIMDRDLAFSSTPTWSCTPFGPCSCSSPQLITVTYADKKITT